MDQNLQVILWIALIAVAIRLFFPGGNSKTENKPSMTAKMAAMTPAVAPSFTASDEAKMRAITGAVITLKALTPEGAWILITPGGAPVTAETAAQIASVALMMHHAVLDAALAADKESPTP